jgi:hypothetical protein
MALELESALRYILIIQVIFSRIFVQ